MNERVEGVKYSRYTFGCNKVCIGLKGSEFMDSVFDGVGDCDEVYFTGYPFVNGKSLFTRLFSV